MVADDVITATALVGGAANNVFGWAIMADHVEVDGREIVDGIAEVTGDGEDFEEDFWHDDRRANVEDDSALEFRDDRGELLEIEIRRLAQHAAVGGRMLMNNVRTNGDVDGNGDVAHDTLVQNAQFPITELAGDNSFTERAPRADALFHAGGQRLVHEPPGFINHPKAAVIESALNVLAGLADISQFKIVDRARAVERDGAEDAALDEIDEHRVEAAFDRVRAHHHDDGLFVAHRRDRGSDNRAEIVADKDARQ